MKKQFRLLMVLATLFTLVMVLPASGQAPPPPAHGQNGNQTSLGGGTGCPLDRTQGIMLALVLSLGYAGFALYQRGKKEVAKEA
jgi:Spy/CpxP family protein refolding chaperone